jgi:hypothetical protein
MRKKKTKLLFIFISIIKMTSRPYQPQRPDPVPMQRTEPVSQTDMLKKEMEFLKSDLEKLKLENTKLIQQNDEYYDMIQEINTENLAIMKLYKFRGKLLKELSPSQEKPQ